MAQRHTGDTTNPTSGPRRIRRRSLLKGAAVGAGALMLGQSAASLAASSVEPGVLAPLEGAGLAAVRTGPSTAVAPYLLPSLPQGVDVVSILTVGERADNGYRLVGAPDGLGAMLNRPPGEPDDDDDDSRGSGAQTFALFANHEIRNSVGIVRAHGSKGAFVSKWTLDRRTLRVLAGEDLTQSPGQVNTWNPVTRQYTAGTTAWDRHCSADLPARKALRHGNRGTRERLYMNGEETLFGRAWARIVTGPNAGQAWELPRLGRMSFENAVACPHGKDRTIVGLFDDGSFNTAPVAASNPSEVCIYVGTKQTSGNEIERAGLTNGKLYGVRVYRGDTLVTEEHTDYGFGDAATGFVGSARFELAELGVAGDVSSMSGIDQEQDLINKNAFRFLRVEDGAWDPRGSDKSALYFVTTGNQNPLRASRLWRLRFHDLDRPEAGGRIDILQQVELGRQLDNLTIDRHGRILIQEDAGNSPAIAKVWLYGIDSGAFIEVAHHDPDLFLPGGPRFITQDEESSGIIDAAHILGEGWFLLDVQVHLPNASDPELIEGGQLCALYVDPRIGR